MMSKLSFVLVVASLIAAAQSHSIVEKIVQDILAALPPCRADQALVNGVCVSKEGGACRTSFFSFSTGCVPNADCVSSKCVCKGNTEPINGLCLKKSNYDSGCLSDYSCDNSLKCIRKSLFSYACTCPQDSSYDSSYPNIVHRPVVGITAATVGACIRNCGPQATFDTTTQSCVCVGETYESESDECVPKTGAVEKEDGIYACPVGTTSEAEECACSLEHSELVDGVCECQGATFFDGSACQPYANAELSDDNVYVCPADTMQNDETTSCDCVVASATYIDGSCQCLGASSPDDESNPTACLPFENAVLDESNIYACPDTTLPNPEQKTCDCPMTSAAFVDGACVCQGDSSPDDETNPTECIGFKFAALDEAGVYACPEGTMANPDTKECQCPFESAQYDPEAGVCVCQGASFPDDETNPSVCIGFENAVLDESATYVCPPSTLPNTDNQVCVCTMQGASYDQQSEQCVCQGASYSDSEQNPTACIPYTASILDSASPDTSVCPDNTTPNDDFRACVTSCVLDTELSTCTCPGDAVSMKDGPTCVPYTGAVYNGDDGSFQCSGDTTPDASAEACI